MKTAKRFYTLFILIGIMVTISCRTNQNDFRFVFITDIHMQPERNAPAGFGQAIDHINTINPDFVISGGDLVFDALAVSHERAQALYTLYQESVKSLNMPLYNTMGNHEVFGLYKESGVSPDHAEFGKRMYEQILGESRYYSFDHKGWHFIVLDGIGFTPDRRYYGHVDDEQLTWLEQDLAAITSEIPIVISTHIPLVSAAIQLKEGGTAANSKGLVIVNSHKVLEKFEQHNLKLVLQGHLHTVEEINIKGTTFLIGGAASGAWWQGANQGFEEGFIIVDIDGKDFNWKYHDYGWVVEKE